MRAKALVAARVGLVLILAATAWRAMNYRSGMEPGPDSSIFMSISWHMAHGHALYKEEQSGPPVIYPMDALALTLGGDGVNSVRAMERGFGVVAALAFFAAVLLAFKRFWLAWVTSALFVIHQYRLNVIEDGNITEEYGAVFVIVGIACAIAVMQWTTGRRRTLAGVTSGVAFGLAVLCKEPFLLIVPPWFAFVAWPRGGDWVDARRRALAFLAGAALPGIAFLGYLVAHGAWSAWLDTIATSMAYTAEGPVSGDRPLILRIIARLNVTVEPMVFLIVTATLGFVVAFMKSVNRKHSGLPLAIAGSALMSVFALSLGGRLYGHYFLMLVPSLALLCASGIAFVADLSTDARRAGVMLALGTGLLAADAKDFSVFADHVTPPVTRWPGHWLTELLTSGTAPTDMIWTPWKPLLYVEARRMAPTRWKSAFDIYFKDTPGSTAEQKFATLRADLSSNPPRAIVISPLPGSGPTRGPADDFLRRSGLTDWIARNYESAMCTAGNDYELLLLKDANPSPARADSSVMVTMRLGLTALYKESAPDAAVLCFRRVLARNPQHYGGNYQLAKALDANGMTADATKQWRIVLRMARQWKDPITEAQALERLK